MTCEGNHPDEVELGATTVVHLDGRRVEKREVKVVRYAEYEFRCRECFPADVEIKEAR